MIRDSELNRALTLRTLSETANDVESTKFKAQGSICARLIKPRFRAPDTLSAIRRLTSEIASKGRAGTI